MAVGQQDPAQPATPARLIAAILLPPLGVFLARGLTPAFWLTVLFTLAGWLPGAVLALLFILAPGLIPIR
jgi:uncharacterized membrane protein YqaE (UPF0057 family)